MQECFGGNTSDIQTDPSEGAITLNQQNIEGWSLAILIPYSLLGTDAPSPGDRWTANFTRYDWDAGEEAMWSWKEESGEIEFQ